MILLEMTDYRLPVNAYEERFDDFCFSISRGDICSIQTELVSSASLFLRAVATLVYPVGGKYFYKDQQLDFSSYRNLLDYKKRIAYIAPEAAMISNKTLRENLLFRRQYFENSLSITLSEHTQNLCRRFNIADKLDMNPADLTLQDVRFAIAIRELVKSPELVLLERPEDYIGHAQFSIFEEELEKIIRSGTPIIYHSSIQAFAAKYANKKLLISGNKITTVNQ
ncbi:MAG: hypothetical protein K9L30_04725 [Desulfobacterales bacterium]|nr:hypothetical protein [Desulfobacterales bacterium]